MEWNNNDVHIEGSISEVKQVKFQGQVVCFYKYALFFVL